MGFPRKWAGVLIKLVESDENGGHRYGRWASRGLSTKSNAAIENAGWKLLASIPVIREAFRGNEIHRRAVFRPGVLRSITSPRTTLPNGEQSDTADQAK
jgi:hypothetical protein